MEIDIFDSALEHEHGISSICLNDEIKFLQSKYHAQIKDIKPISSLDGGRHFIVAIFYEKPSTLQQKEFDWTNSEEEINEFIASHDVVKVEHFNGEDYGDVNTIVTYRKTDNSYGTFDKWKKASGQNG